MKRRNFFKIAAPLASAPFVASANPLAPLFRANLLNNLNCEGIEDRVLVIVYLDGGNDGINTIVPIQQYDDYVNLRPQIHLKDTGTNAFMPLDNTLPLNQQVGLHPIMTGMKDLYDQGLVNIIQGAGYNGGINGSHFKGTDLWLTGGDGTTANFNKQNGWMGRYLDYVYPNIIEAPTDIMPDPPALRMSGYGVSGFASYNGQTSMGMAYNDFSGYHYYLASDGINHPTHFPDSHFGDELRYLSNTRASADAFSGRLAAVGAAGNNIVTYPNTNFGRQLRSVARYVSGGCKSKIYHTNMGSFDLHIRQTEAASHLGEHTRWLDDLSQSIKAFQDDITALGIADKILLMTFSEFGRSAYEAGGRGTDHGTLGPMFIVGNAVQAGMTGINLNLTDTANSNFEGLGGLQNDHRQVYTSLLQDWLGAADEVIEAAEMGEFLNQKIPIINTDNIVSSECYIGRFVLPVELLAFHATLNDKKEVILDWATASETDNMYFEVERSSDGTSFRAIEKVYSKGDSSSTTDYQTLDKEPLVGTSYYRLKQMDYYGKSSYSDIQSVSIEAETIKNVKVYPNPAVYDANVVFTTLKDSWMNIAIYNTQGILVEKDRFYAKAGFNKKSYNVRHLSKAMYMIRIEAEDLYYQVSLKLQVH